MLQTISRFFSVPKCAETMEMDFRALSVKVENEISSTIQEMLIELIARNLMMKIEHRMGFDHGRHHRKMVIEILIEIVRAIRLDRRIKIRLFPPSTPNS